MTKTLSQKLRTAKFQGNAKSTTSIAPADLALIAARAERMRGVLTVLDQKTGRPEVVNFSKPRNNPPGSRSKARGRAVIVAPQGERTAAPRMDTRSSKTTNPTKQLLHQTMEPASAELLRLPVEAFTAGVGTGLARTVDTITIDWSQANTISTGDVPHMGGRAGLFPLQEDMDVEPVILLRDPIVSHIQRNIRPTGNATAKYDVVLSFEGGTDASGLHGNLQLGVGCEVHLPITGLTYQGGGWKPYGESTPAGLVGTDNHVIWIDGSPTRPWNIEVIVDTPVGGPTDDAFYFNTLRLICYKHVSEHQKELAFSMPNTQFTTSTIIPPPGTYLWPLTFDTRHEFEDFGIDRNLTESAYYSFELHYITAVVELPSAQKKKMLGEIFNLSDGGNTFEVDVTLARIETNVRAAYQHVVPLAMQDKSGVVRQVRMLGASGLFQNVSAELARGGTVYAVQATGERPWYNLINNVTDISDLNLVSRYVGDWKKGLYAYVKPQGDSPFKLEMAYQESTNNPSVATDTPGFRPFRDAGYVVVQIKPPTQAEDSATYSPSVMTLHVVRAFEFTSTDQFFDIEPSHLHPSYMSEYALAIANAPQFFENPLHMAEIMRLIRSASGAVVRVSPYVRGGLAVAAIVKGFLDMWTRPGKNPPPLD